jgi:tetratricopeptide (TPR) repeat protein
MKLYRIYLSDYDLKVKPLYRPEKQRRLFSNWRKFKLNKHSCFWTVIFVFLQSFFSFQEIYAQDFKNEKYFLYQIRLGDSLLNVNKFNEARTFYKKGNDAFLSDNFKRNYLSYKTGYSYLVQEEGFLALAYFTDVLLSFEQQSTYDSAFKLLVTTETDLLTIEVLSPTYDFEGLKSKYNSYRKELSSWEKSRFEYLIGSIYYKRLDYNNAIKNFKRSLSFQHSDTWLKEWSWYNIGVSYFELLDFQKSAEIFLFLQNEKYVHLSHQQVLFMLGKTYMAVKDYDQAIKYFKKVLKFSTNEQVQKQIIQAYINIGNCFLASENKMAAYTMYDKAEDFCTKAKIESKEYILPLIAKGNYFGTLNNFDQQNHYLFKALEYLENNDDIFLRSTIIENLIKTFYQTNKFEQVIDLINLFTEKYKSMNSMEIKNSIGWTRYQSFIQYRALSAYRIWQTDSSDVDLLKQAYQYYNSGLEDVSDGFFAMESEESKMGELKSMREIYSYAFIATYDLYRLTSDRRLLDELFILIENSKANIFKTNFQNSKAIEFSDIPAEYVKLSGILKKQIAWLRFNLNNASENTETARNIPKLRKELALNEMRYDSLINFFETEYPQYYSARINPHKYNIELIQDEIHRDQVLLDYYLVDNRLFIFCVSKQNVGLRVINIDSIFGSKIMAFREYLIRPNFDSDVDSSCFKFGVLSNYLYNNLIKPVNKEIESRRLIIIPDRELNLIPFLALVVDTVGLTSKDFSELDYLVYSNPVTTLYSIEQFFTQEKFLTRKSKYLGLAPKYSLRNSKEITSLPGTDFEISNTAMYFDGVCFIGSDATKKNFLENCSDFDIIHLALHTEINEVEPLYSKILFSPDSPESSENADPMFVYEIFEYPMQAKLLVLSGCNTGYGKLEFGEGIMNLARTFFYNGVENIVATHWSVADKSSASLMGYFYNYLLKREPVDIAMQKAKIDFLKYEDPLRSHPYYWAGYISIGNPVVYSPNRWLWFLPFLILSIFGAIVYTRKLHKQRINPE